MIDPHTLSTLEFGKVINHIAGHCITPYGRPNVEQFVPLSDLNIIEKRLREIGQMQDILTVGAAFPLSRMFDVRELLDKSAVEGTFLDPEEIRHILELIEVSIDLQSYDEDGRESFDAIAAYLDEIRAFPELRKEILRTIDERNEIKDSASSELRKIRNDLHETRRRLLARLENILAGSQKQAGWQDDVVTQRNGRYVIPVLSGQYNADDGILHDRSQSGATFYIEPKETVETNNRLNMLMQEERREIDRILRALTAEIAMRHDALQNNIRIIGLLDSYHAAARFAKETGGHRPAMSHKPGFSLIDARHPLLVKQSGNIDKVVPLTLRLDNDRQSILVTGPNTGGKTIALKTIGLAVLMAQSGLPISADEKSSVGIFRQVHADIGDEQSIELSLSTFSSHITNIINALGDIDSNTLILFDEIGAGTDPKEGAALAEAIILYALEKGAKLVATTHYSQLKTLPLDNPGIENASLEFNRETLAPSYNLRIGIPGSSYAVEIANRLGMPKSICERAAEAVGDGERSLGDLISSLEGELAKIKEDKAALSERLAKATELEAYYKARTEHLDKEVETERRKHLAETEHLLETTRRETEALVAEIRKTQASRGAVKQAHKQLQQKTAEVARHREKDRTRDGAETDQTVFEKGDHVRVISLDQVGDIDKVTGEKARVQVGHVTLTVPLRNLEKLGDKRMAKARRGTSASVKTKVSEDISPEIHLRGMTVDEAIEALERFIERAVMAGLGQIYVIHGKGTGTLRRTLTNFLKQHREVASLRLGNWNEGGAGVTIVKLRQ